MPLLEAGSYWVTLPPSKVDVGSNTRWRTSIPHPARSPAAPNSMAACWREEMERNLLLPYNEPSSLLRRVGPWYAKDAPCGGARARTARGS